MLPNTQTVTSPVQVMDVVERGGLCEAHSCLPDVFAAVDGLHALYRVLRVEKNHFIIFFISFIEQQKFVEDLWKLELLSKENTGRLRQPKLLS